MTLYSFNSNVTILVEFGFGSGPFTASPTWTDVAAYCQGLTSDRGRQSVNAHFDAGSVSIILDNMTGRFDPNNSSSPYAGNMRIGTPVRIRVTHNAITYPLFRGSVARWPLHYPDSGHDAIVEIEAVENLAVLNRAQVTASYPVQSSSARLTDIADDAGWPAAVRDFDTGTVNVAAVDFAGAALAGMRAAVDAEQGNLFIARDGDLTFHNRVAYSTAASAATFNPGTNLDYAGVSLAYDDDYLINQASVTAANEEVGTATDATSIANHGAGDPYEVTLDTVLDGNYARNVAEWVVGKYKDVAVRVVGLTIDPDTDPADLFPEVLGRELRDLITVVVNPPGAGTNLNQVVAVEGVHHEISPDSWVTSYSCYPLSDFEAEDYWIIGTSQLGINARVG